jgi:hypothetical protein
VADIKVTVENLAELLEDEIALIMATEPAEKHTERIAKAISTHFEAIACEGTQSFACKKGCSYCCAIEAFARPVEIFSVARFVRLAARHKMLGNIDAFTAKLRRVYGEDPEARYRKRKPCPFLFDGGCAVYAVRPLMCRFFVSRDLDRCIRFSQGSEENIPYDQIRVVAVIACGQGLSASLGAKGILDGSYSLAGGVSKALRIPDLETRWLRGEDVFADVRMDKGGNIQEGEEG